MQRPIFLNFQNFIRFLTEGESVVGYPGPGRGVALHQLLLGRHDVLGDQASLILSTTTEFFAGSDLR